MILMVFDLWGRGSPIEVSCWKWSIHDRDRKLVYFNDVYGRIQPT